MSLTMEARDSLTTWEIDRKAQVMPRVMQDYRERKLQLQELSRDHIPSRKQDSGAETLPSKCDDCNKRAKLGSSRVPDVEVPVQTTECGFKPTVEETSVRS
jgi:hypothetical protein